MKALAKGVSDWVVLRQVFPAWSIEIPPSFDETFISEDGDYGYWHAFEERRSVSLTSIVIEERGKPVSAERILAEIPPLSDGSPVDEFPEGLPGWAVTSDAELDARASRILSGMLVVHGRVLLATITTDDLDWARRTWLSIRYHPGARCQIAKQRRGGPSQARPATRRRASRSGRGR